MIGNDFLSVFEHYKSRYLQQDQDVDNKNALDSFEKWLRKNTGIIHINKKEKKKKIDLGSFISEIFAEAKKLLEGKGISINGISLGLKESSRCITVFNDKTIYYRVGRTSPRKGRYRGMDMLVMEMVMDGNKNSVFMPLLKRVEDLERQVGIKIERENEKVEATGKYRLKLLFPLENDDSEMTVVNYARILADFIYHTRKEVLRLNVV
ncbi:MAG: hypothetical protein ACOY30_01305 [Bacillota bacterium]